MDKIIKFIWVLPVSFGLWLIYKLFVKPEKEEVTPNNSGLSAVDVTLYYQVCANLEKGGNPWEIGITDFIFPLFSGMSQNANLSNAVKLGELLNKVQDKQRFAEVYYKEKHTLLTTSIINVYGDTIYNTIARNVSNFGSFMI
jgi:hypothetical protein